MNTLRELLDEYEQLKESRFASSHDFTRRQRALEAWADKAQKLIGEIVARHPELDCEFQPILDGSPLGKA